MSAVPEIPLSARLRLAHGCLEHLSRAAGTRIVHVKGEALHPVLARGRMKSTDCDVLVHPDDVAAYCRQLVDAGWVRITRFRHGSVFEHAATYYHRVWGTVDVHRTFPGLDRDPVATFDHLRKHHETVLLGGFECAVPDLCSQRLLLLTHAARDAMGRAEHDVHVAWIEADAAERKKIDALALSLGAVAPLALATDRGDLAIGEPHEHLWRAVHARAEPTEVWRARLHDACTVRETLQVLSRSARVNPDHLALRLGRRPDSRELHREWWDRWRRAGLYAAKKARTVVRRGSLRS